MSSLGQILRSRREELGKDLKDVEAALSIRVKYLEALELENFSVIPGEVYTKGFLRNYANYLGLNAEEMVQLYKNTLESRDNTKTETNETQPPSPKKKKAKPKRSGFAFGFGMAVLLLVIAGAAYFAYPYFAQKAPGDIINAPPKSAAPLPQSPVPQAQPQPVPTVPQPQKEVKASQGMKLTIKAKEDCWVWVIADGKEVFEGILIRGESKTWQAKNKMEISLGNAGGIDITYNDQPQASLGASGDVVHKVYTSQ